MQEACAAAGGTHRGNKCSDLDMGMQYYGGSMCEDEGYAAFITMRAGPACCTDGVSSCGAYTPVICANPDAFNGLGGSPEPPMRANQSW